jgi:hypothetical protein
MFGGRFDAAGSDVVAASDIRIQLGATASLNGRPKSVRALDWGAPSVGFAVDYGLPGKAGYTHSRPFDYFRLDGMGSVDGFESLTARGLIAGRDYRAGEGGRGVWGVFGGYDYFAPDIFRVSGTGLSFGATTQSWPARSLALQSTALLGMGYSAVQSAGSADDRDYHYGAAPQALASVRLIAGSWAALDLTARGYFISSVAGFGAERRDTIFRGDASVAVRLYRQHAIAVRYLLSRRNATPSGLSDLSQSSATIGLFYTFLGSGGFGAVR